MVPRVSLDNWVFVLIFKDLRVFCFKPMIFGRELLPKSIDLPNVKFPENLAMDRIITFSLKNDFV